MRVVIALSCNLTPLNPAPPPLFLLFPVDGSDVEDDLGSEDEDGESEEDGSDGAPAVNVSALASLYADGNEDVSVCVLQLIVFLTLCFCVLDFGISFGWYDFNPPFHPHPLPTG